MNISIGSDHAGVELKQYLSDKLYALGHEIIDRGTNSSDSVDYPDHGHAVCVDVSGEQADMGILICGTANGMAMTANKHEDIRCGLCWTPEIAELTKQHNNANVIALPARFISIEEGWKIVEAYLNAEFEGGRHERRINKIPA